MSRLTSPFSSQHPPPSQHGEVIEGLRPVFLYRHRHTNRHPALGLIRWDADRLVGRNPRQPTHILDIRLSEILIRRRPLADNRSDRKQPILMIIRTCEQVEGSPPTIRHTLKLTKTCIRLLGCNILF